MFAISKLAVFFSRAILAAENKHSITVQEVSHIVRMTNYQAL